MKIVRLLSLELLMILAGSFPPLTMAQSKTPTLLFQRKKAPAVAKPTAAVPTKWPIETLTVEGNHNYSPEQILAVAGLRTGQLAGKEEFEAARDRLVATGAFETVGYRFAPAPNSSGYAASFQVVEATPVYPVQFEFLNVPAAELSAWLKSKDPLFGPKIPGTTAVLEKDARWIEAFLTTKNQAEKVVAKIVATAPDQFAIVFRPATALPAVVEVKFEGNKVIPTTVLQNAISSIAFGVPYTEPGFRQLLDTSIRPLYEARGRVNVTFPKITTEPAGNVKGIVVNISIDEGTSYEIGDVKIAGDRAAESPALLKLANLKSGDLANMDEVSKAVERIKSRLRKDGYIRAAITVERKLNDSKKTVDLALRIDEGPQFSFGALTIEGLDLNGEAAIRKLWALKEARPFNGDYPDLFLDRIREEGLFDNRGDTKAVVNANEQTHVVNVTLQFRPPSKGSGEASRELRRRP